MDDYSKLVKALRHCTDNEPSNGDCWNCPYQGEKCHTLLSDAAAAIEALQAEIRESMQRCAECGDELAHQMPKRGKWLPGREISRSYIGDCCVSIDFEDWRCSICGNIIEIPCNPKYKYCPNCGAKMEVQE